MTATMLYKKILTILKHLNEDSRHDNLKLVSGMYYDNVSSTLFEYPLFTDYIDSDKLDYFRFRELELLSQEIKRKQVPGEVAEIGVYKGDFAAKINHLFPSKKLYLFDTYSGFTKNDVEYDIENKLITEGFMSIISQYSNTSIQYVLKQMENPEKCIIKAGNFPQSLNGLDEKFCFVSIDVDLYTPTLNALNYFYPRLQKGGYIMVHDYNHDELSGVKKAVLEYETIETDLSLLPIADQCGTLIITK